VTAAVQAFGFRLYYGSVECVFNDHINEKLSDLKDKNVENSQSINRMRRIIDKLGKF
jgi:demethoxyubiquinone hydroxylase (CLK1/Coq7/Cat5 family)